MKKIVASKFLTERTEKVVRALNAGEVGNNDRAQALAYVLELPNKNVVRPSDYGDLLVKTVQAINDGVEIVFDDFVKKANSVVEKSKRVLSPEVRQARYEKACQRLAKRYGIKEE